MCSGLVMASKTRRRGASNSRVRPISRSEGVVTLKVSLFAALLTGMSFLLRFELLQIGLEAIEPLFPDRAIALRPFGHFFQRCRFEPAGPPLRLAPPDDQSSPLEDAQVFGDGGHAHLERLGQFGDR